jgi:hypothetical protein
VRTGLEIAVALRKLYPNDWEVDRYGRLLVNAQILEMVKSGAQAADIERAAQPKIDEFIKRRAPFLLYK